MALSFCAMGTESVAADANSELQWFADLAKANNGKAIDSALWIQRFHALGPIRVCAIIPGEAAPYPSCVDQRMTGRFRESYTHALNVGGSDAQSLEGSRAPLAD